MASYYLIHWDQSRSGQFDEWAVHDAQGTEYDSWPSDPRNSETGNGEATVELYQAIAQGDLPGDSNLPSAADQAHAMGVLQSGEWEFRRESGSGAPW